MLTWDDIYNAAIDKPWLSSQLRAKDTAREQLAWLMLEELDMSLACCENPEEAIEDFLSQRKELVYFDERGIIIQK